MSNVYVGLDPSLTGFGVAAVGADVERVWLLKPKKRGVDRLLEVSYLLSDVFSELRRDGHHIEDVAVEDTVRASYSASALGELAGVVKMTCHTVLTGKAQYPLKVPPTTLKKYATGRGNAKKAEMLLAVYKHFGMEIRDDNQADAYLLSRIAQGHASNAVQRQILEQLQEPKFRDADVL